MLDRKRIGEILTELGVLTPDEIERVLTAMRRRDDFAKFGQVAKEMGLTSEAEILAALAVQMELFQGACEMTLAHILRRLGDPIQSNPKMPMKAVRRKLGMRSR
jgi:hypothetical protein